MPYLVFHELVPACPLCIVYYILPRDKKLFPFKGEVKTNNDEKWPKWVIFISETKVHEISCKNGKKSKKAKKGPKITIWYPWCSHIIFKIFKI